MKKFLRSLKHAFRGITIVSREERNFQIQLAIAILLIIFMIISDFSAMEVAMIILAIVSVLGSEMINTAIENTLNKLHPEHDTAVGKIKDISAGFVFIVSFGSFLVGMIIFISHFF